MIKPIGNNIVVLEKSREQVSASGITYKLNQRYGDIIEGKVLGVGELVTSLKEGDTILYGAKTSVEVEKADDENVIAFITINDVKGVKIDD